jgi:Predicted membrane protein
VKKPALLRAAGTMKKNTFYLLSGIIAVALLAIFWYSIELHAAFLIEPAFIIGIVVVYLTKRKVTDKIEDERDAKIKPNRLLCARRRSSGLYSVQFLILAVMELLHVPTFPRDTALLPPPDIRSPRMMGYIQLGLLCLMIFLYVGFRIYYARKYGDFETGDE